LARFCFEEYPNICVVVASAYRDFEYAKEAMRYNVAEYITKPVVYRELRDAMLRAARRPRQAQGRGFADADALSSCQLTFSNLLCGVYTDAQGFLDDFSHLGLRADPENAPLVLMNMHVNRFEEYMLKSWKHGQFELYNAIGRMIPFETPDAYFMLLRYAAGNIELLGICKRAGARAREIAEAFMRDFKRNLLEILNVSAELNVTEEFPSPAAAVALRAAAPPEDAPATSGVDRAAGYIRKHYDEALTLESVARQVNISPMYFSAYFKKHAGENFLDFLTRTRMEKARELLADKDVKISSVCQMVGYKNATHFYNVFKAYNNMTPAQYRDAAARP
jgi:two-component system response regulator YesN